jgi:hypothetical protein
MASINKLLRPSLAAAGSAMAAKRVTSWLVMGSLSTTATIKSEARETSLRAKAGGGVRTLKPAPTPPGEGLRVCAMATEAPAQQRLTARLRKTFEKRVINKSVILAKSAGCSVLVFTQVLVARDIVL